MGTPAAFLVALVRAHRWSPGCETGDADAIHRDEVDFCAPQVADQAPSGTSSAGAAVASRADLLTCGRLLISSLNASAAGGGGGGAINGRGLDDTDLFDEEEEEVFNREWDAIGARDWSVGHADPDRVRSPLSIGSTASGGEMGVFFRLPSRHEKQRELWGIGVADSGVQRQFLVQQEARFLVLLSNVPFQTFLRSLLEETAATFFKQQDTLRDFDVLEALHRRLTSKIDFAELPYREIHVGLPVVPLVRWFCKDIMAVLRVVLLEGRVACFSSDASAASAAPLALLALLPGMLAESAGFTSRTIQAVIYRLRRFGMPFSLFHDGFVLQPCFASGQEEEVYASKGFLVGVSDSLLLKNPKAQLDLIVDLDIWQVVAFPTLKTEHAFGFGGSATALIDSVMRRIDSANPGASHRGALTDSKSQSPSPGGGGSGRGDNSSNRLERQQSRVGAAMESIESDTDWVLGQFQTYFEQFLEEGFRGLFGSSSSGDGTTDESSSTSSSSHYDPYHPSIRTRLEDLTAPVFGEHAKFYSDYGRAWTHAWQQTHNYSEWVSAHRLERRRSTVAMPTPPPQEGHAMYMYPNGDEYDGEFVRGKRHGFGVYVEFVTKNQYEGDWERDERHGKGVLTSKISGYIYDGEWKHDMRSGHGHSALKNVETYTGEWLDNFFHGMGVYTNADGDVFNGEWHRGVKHGAGKVTVARRRREDEFEGVKQYTGEFVNGKFHGMGACEYMDGTEYSGGFQDGKRHGNGVLVRPNGDRYDGQWWKGFRHGEGSAYSGKSGITKEGTWQKDADVDGTWFIVYQNGDKYSGECRRGRPWGEGVCKYANGSSYSGAWADGLREGFGVCVNPDGSMLEGEWKNSVFVKSVRRPSRFVDIPLSTEGQQRERRSSSSASSSLTSRCDDQSVSHPADGHHVHVYPNGDVYDGEFRGGKRHGFGVFTERATGNVYEGEWDHDSRHGSGVLTSGLKDFIYDGHWERDVRQGYGHCVIRGCETYSGHWSNNQFHGTGKYIDAEGAVYEGEFAYGKKHGVGKQMSSSGGQKGGVSYSGEWREGVREGIGDAVFVDGSTYSGSWKNDRQDGEGTFVSGQSGGEKYVGQWRRGRREGAGVLSIAASGVTKEGEWVADEPVDGDWTITFPDGSKFTGECVKGRPHGRGVCKYANGDLYDGMWVNGKRHGTGTGFFANGESFVGDWENNHVALNGRGRLTLRDGTEHVYAK